MNTKKAEIAVLVKDAKTIKIIRLSNSSHLAKVIATVFDDPTPIVSETETEPESGGESLPEQQEAASVSGDTSDPGATVAAEESGAAPSHEAEPAEPSRQAQISEETGLPDDRPETDQIDTTGIDHLYKVELDVFEGPMDLLLYLIKKDEIDIYDIPIEGITKQYMGYLETFKMLNIGLAGEFLVMAANLCYIKSRMMLPKHVQPPEEDADEEDPRWDLIRQLIEYKKFKEAARHLGEKEEKQLSHFARVPDKIETDKDEKRPLSDEVGIFDLIKAFQNILDRFQDEGLGEIVDDHFTVSDKIDHLLSTIDPGGSIRFSSLFAGATSKNEMIVTFLAVLELMKLNYFRVRQEVLLGDIELERNQF